MTPYPPQFFWAFLCRGMGGLFHLVPVTRALSSSFPHISCSWTVLRSPAALPGLRQVPCLDSPLPGSLTVSGHRAEGLGWRTWPGQES